ncbi:PilZ domain-containing protein [Mangrovibrevibacter kandeliae]|uniref:PilZ domain-containing protein n=1 Tax=Mangrovibrevibacter kandeliae TaxID=2968473 RepID=UPI0021199FE5|nr:MULTISPECIES: PilZ domain-containing protein [unclassified Aurantimonas]MCQ8781263.1 PilZ domain-containing protein [Aurantimonas sp. CSK15Z-1]MCW4114045.1 PilZ domain-containing protein [Aurantimonas sp. MSK8Z-1]
MTALPSMEPDGAERRTALRTRTLKRAKILFNNHFSTIDCIVRNISDTGALLTLDESVHLPKAFDVRVGEEKDHRPAKLVYRRGMFAGIRFTDIDEEAGPSQPAASPGPAAAPSVEFAPSEIVRIQHRVLPAALRRNFAWF